MTKNFSQLLKFIENNKLDTLTTLSFAYKTLNWTNLDNVSAYFDGNGDDFVKDSFKAYYHDKSTPKVNKTYRAIFDFTRKQETDTVLLRPSGPPEKQTVFYGIWE